MLILDLLHPGLTCFPLLTQSILQIVHFLIKFFCCLHMTKSRFTNRLPQLSGSDIKLCQNFFFFVQLLVPLIYGNLQLVVFLEGLDL